MARITSQSAMPQQPGAAPPLLAAEATAAAAAGEAPSAKQNVMHPLEHRCHTTCDIANHLEPLLLPELFLAFSNEISRHNFLNKSDACERKFPILIDDN